MYLTMPLKFFFKQVSFTILLKMEILFDKRNIPATNYKLGFNFCFVSDINGY